MHYWIAIATISYLLFAINSVIDKFLLMGPIKHPSMYAFFVGLSSGAILILAPFGLHILKEQDMAIALLGGAIFTYALYFLYCASRFTSVSRLVPIEAGLVAVCTLVFSYIFLHESLTGLQLGAFVLLVFGAVSISLKKNEMQAWRPSGLLYALVAAVLFSASLVLTKMVYNHTNFISGLIWTRLGLFVGALTFLFTPQFRKHLLTSSQPARSGSAALFYSAQGLGALASFLQNYAIALGSVVIVNALQATQFMFVLIITIVLSLYFPKVLKEELTRTILIQKVLAIGCISLGLVLLTR